MVKNKENLPKPFSGDYHKRTDGGTVGDECILCGRHTGNGKNTFYVHVVDGGTRIALPDDEGNSAGGDMGFFPVGVECAKRLPAEYLT